MKEPVWHVTCNTFIFRKMYWITIGGVVQASLLGENAVVLLPDFIPLVLDFSTNLNIITGHNVFSINLTTLQLTTISTEAPEIQHITEYKDDFYWIEEGASFVKCAPVTAIGDATQLYNTNGVGQLRYLQIVHPDRQPR